VDWEAILKVLCRKPRALEYSSFLVYLPPALKEYLLVPDLVQRKKRLTLVVNLLADQSIQEVASAVAEALREGRTDEGSIRHILYRRAHRLTLEPLVESYTPACVTNYDPDLTQYDRLTRGGGTV
jgi:hypothetical protein